MAGGEHLALANTLNSDPEPVSMRLPVEDRYDLLADRQIPKIEPRQQQDIQMNPVRELVHHEWRTNVIAPLYRLCRRLGLGMAPDGVINRGHGFPTRLRTPADRRHPVPVG